MDDVSSAVPILVGVVGSQEDAARDTRGLGAAFAGIVQELRNRYPQTPVVVLTTLISGPEVTAVSAIAAQEVTVIACRQASDTSTDHQLKNVSLTRPLEGDPRDLVAYASDLLVIVSSGAASPDLLVYADRRRTGEPPPVGFRKLLAPPDVGPYFHLEGDTVTRFYPLRFAGDVRAEADFAAGLARRNRYNSDLRAVPAPSDGNALTRLRARTAVVTSSLQDRTHLGQHVLYLLAFLAASIQVFTFSPYGPYVKFGAVVLAFLVYFFVRGRDYQNRYQDYRAISEALRVQIVWSAVGIAESVEESYLPMQQTDLQWIRNVLRTVHFLDWRTVPVTDAYDVVLNWITLQHKYFTDHSRIEAQKRSKFDSLASVLGGLGLLASVAVLGIEIAHAELSPPMLAADIGLFATFVAVCVAIIRSYSRSRGHSENANRYQRMFFVFDKALEVLKKAKGREDGVRTVARELGREALAEHAEWLLMQRERPISVVRTEAG